MGALTARTATEKRTAASDVAVKGNVVYARTVTFPLADGETAGGPVNITGLVIPADTLILGGTVKASVDQGATATFVFTAGTALNTAMKLNGTTRLALGSFVPTLCATDTQVTLTTAAAAVTGAVLELTLVLCAVGTEPATYSSFTN